MLPSKYHHNTNPPPYTGTGYTQVPKDLNAANLESNVVTKSRLEKFPAITNCFNCNLQVNTNVEKKVSSGGWTWAILCCCFGSWLLSLLVLCLDCFHEWVHYCPRCSQLLATYTPSASGKVKALLGLATVGIIALQIALVIFLILPMMLTDAADDGRGYY